MEQFLSRVDTGELIGLCAVIGGLICGTICGGAAIIGYYVVRSHEADLKQTMLSRGMSADEIVAVIEAGSNSRSNLLCARTATHA